MTIDEIYRLVLSIANKTQRGNIKPSDFNLWAEAALFEWFMDGYGNKEEYQAGRPVPRIAYQKTQKISDDLRTFIKSVEIRVNSDSTITVPDGITVKDVDGNILPEYVHLTALRTIYKKVVDNVVTSRKTVPVTMYKEEELGNVLQSEIVNPTERFPVAAFIEDKVQFYPTTLITVEFAYLRIPVKPVWAFTVSNGRPVYDPANSVDIEAPADAQNDIVNRILNRAGINLREPELEQYTQLEKRQGI